MSDNVIGLARPTVVPGCVKFCEELLAKAKAGQVHFVAIASQGADGSYDTGWSSCPDFPIHSMGMMGAITTLEHEFFSIVCR